MIWEHLWLSGNILASGNLYRISVIHWGHPENIWKQLRISENISGTSENISGTSENIWHHPEKRCPHRGWLCIKVAAQLKTLENSWEHRKTSKIIWYHPMNNWGPIIDNLVQFEEDFNIRTEMWLSGYLRPDQFLDHLTVLKIREICSETKFHYTTKD